MKTLGTKTQFTAAELANMKLVGLPSTKGKIIAVAERQSWSYAEVSGKGGKRRVYTPPTEVLEAIRQKAAEQLAAIAPVKPAELPAVIAPTHRHYTSDQVLKGDARKGVLDMITRIMNETGYPLKKAARTLLNMARDGKASPQLVATLKLARDERGRQSPDGLPSERSLLRFVDYSKAGQIVPKKREADMRVPAWAKAFMECYQRPEKPTVEHAYRQFCDRYSEDRPSIHQVRRFLAKVGNVSVNVGRMGSHELKTLRGFIRRSFDQLLPTDIYSADGHTFDAEVQHPFHGRPFRPEITTVVDIATRKVVGWSVGLAESSLAVLDALRVSVQNGGIMAVLYVDNGSGYVNQMMTDAGTGLMARLGAQMVNSLPYSSQARGVIERLHQTIWVKAAKEVPGYIGADMDRQAKLQVFKLSRQALVNKPGQASTMPLMPWDLFVKFTAEKVAEYNDKPHSSLDKTIDPNTGKKRHLTPNEAWAIAEEKGFAPMRVTADEAETLFRPQVMRTIRRCEIELFSNRYYSKELEEFNGTELRVGYDIHDPSTVWVYSDSGKLICTAELDGNQVDYMPQSFIERARDNRAAGRERRLENKLEEVRAERTGTPALEVIQGVQLNTTADELRKKWAIERGEAPLVQPMRTESQANNVIDMEETPQDRFNRWLETENFIQQGGEIDKAQMKRHTNYQLTSEYRTFARRHGIEINSTVGAVLKVNNY